MIMTWMKIIEFSELHGYLWKHVMIVAAVLLMLIALYWQRKRVGKTGTVLGFLIGIVGLCVYLDREYTEIRKLFHTSIPSDLRMEFMLEQKITADDFVSDFDEIDRYIRIDKWYEKGKHKGVSLDSLYQTYRSKIAQVHHKKDYFDLLQRYFSALKNTHTHLFYRKYKAPAKAEWRGDSLYVCCLQWDIPLHEGDRILEINGQDVLAWRDSMYQYIAASTDRSRSLLTANHVFESYTDSARTYTLLHGDSLYYTTLSLYRDYYQQMSIAWKEESKRMPKQDTLSKVQTNEENSPYKEPLFPSKNFPYKTLELNSFREYDAHWLIKKFQYEKERKNLIIDLTRNRGGRVQLVHEVARYFLKKPMLTLYKDTLKPHPDAYQGPLYVMISRETASAGEYLASLLQESQSAVLVGEETCGDFGGYCMTFCTSHGTLFGVGAGKLQRTVAGRLTEGMGLMPDVPVEIEANRTVSESIRETTIRTLLGDME